jgi:transcriptional antiterminator RfaH
MFALLDFERECARLRYTHGLRDIVRFGNEPVVVPERIIGELKKRCASGPLELPERTLVAHERVTVTDGPFREFEGVFERYLSGSERVAILFCVMGAGARALLPARMVVPVA